MVTSRASRILAGSVLFLLTSMTQTGWAVMPTNPVTDSDFTRLPNGTKLSEIRVSGSRLSLAKGSGNSFSSSKQKAYEKLKQATKDQTNHKVQWVFMDLDANRVIDQSLSADRAMFGASTSKIFVGAALLDRKGGNISKSQLQLMADMLVVSSNTAWTNLQKQIGDGSADKGRERIYNFTQRMGYEKTMGFQGYWGDVHGNELTASELGEFMHDLYKGNFPGAETEWKIMHACRTGASRGRKYLPKSLYVGGKTGTYRGSTEDAETGRSTTVNVKNHVLTFHSEGRQYALAVLANDGSDESAALLAGGLYREYASR